MSEPYDIWRDRVDDGVIYAPGVRGRGDRLPNPTAPKTCPNCHGVIDMTPIRAWIGTPPQGWKPGDPRPHICPPYLTDG
jgi:hypothetical protein